MPEITLPARRRPDHGSSTSRRLRREGRVPGVVYGHGLDPVSVYVDAPDLRHALGTRAGANALLDLDLGDAHHLVMARELQRDPVRKHVTHVDFLVVRRDEMITTDVPISLVGEAEAVHRADGHVDQELLALSVNARAGSIPQQIEVDVASLEIGDSIRVGDLKLPPDVTTDVDTEAIVVVAHPPRAGLEEGGPEGAGAAAAAGAEEAGKDAEGGGDESASSSEGQAQG